MLLVVRLPAASRHTLQAALDRVQMASMKYMFAHYGWNSEIFQAPLIQRMLQGIRLTTRQVISPKGVFTLSQLKSIIYACAHFLDPFLYRSAFLFAFHAFFRISNIAPPLSLRHLTLLVIYLYEISLSLSLGLQLGLNGPRIFKRQNAVTQ